jgi:transcriptional regulator of arginine metabolism
MSGKRERQAAILQVVRDHRVPSQDALREHLLEMGIEVTQATVSRDVRDLRLAKVPDAQGGGYYAPPEEPDDLPPLTLLLPALFRSAETVGNQLVVRTMTGSAPSVSLGIDWEEWPEVVGTVAGDDTILVICRDDRGAETVGRRLAEIAGEKGPADRQA